MNIKKLLLAAACFGLLSTAFAQIDFDINVEGVSGLVVGDTVGSAGTFGDLNIDYVLGEGETLVFDGSAEFTIRYITNKVGSSATYNYEHCEYDADTDKVVCDPGLDSESDPVGQFESAYITVTAGAPDGATGVSGIDAFEGVLALEFGSDGCPESAQSEANDFEYTAWDGFSYGGTEHSEPADLTELQQARAQSNIGTFNDGSQVEFDADDVILVGGTDEFGQIRGAACGADSGEGLIVQVEPVILDTSILLPEGTTEARIVVTMWDQDGTVDAGGDV